MNFHIYSSFFGLAIVLFFCFNEGLSIPKPQAPEPPPGYLAGQAARPAESPEPGLLFYLSGEQGTTADFAAGGQQLPNFVRSVETISDGAQGRALQAEDDQLLSYWAPGNIYAQRGTLSFFWRSRYPVGPTEFPVFRVGYADHSSWDMVWLRIDYNGSGFDAFVTDIGLTRTRVSYHMDAFPGPDQWIHLALSWDETEGIRFYVNGEMVAWSTVTGSVYDTGLDQFGPHSRIISPYQVQSRYNFKRGGDLDELRIYDRMLSDQNIARLARAQSPGTLPALDRDLSERSWRDAWWKRHGWNRPNAAPPPLPASQARVRKVEIHEAIDIKRWYWKANDGIRETTWPGVYNMSRLPGRYDYFVLPDWDCYSMSGQTVRFTMPDEPWNHLEIWGNAWGQLTHESDHPYDHTFAVRKPHQVKSIHRLEQSKTGGVIRFDNALMEEPIGSFMAYHVEEASLPPGLQSRSYRLHTVSDAGTLDSSLERIAAFIRGRYPADERQMMVGVSEAGSPRPMDHPVPEPVEEPMSGAVSSASPRPMSGAANPVSSRPMSDAASITSPQPVIHMMIPWQEMAGVGLDGIVLEIPGLEVSPTHGDLFPLNVRVKDPLWEMRDLIDFSFSVRPGQGQTLWLDHRGRMEPQGRGLYVTLSGAGGDLTPEMLQGMRIRLVYREHEEILTEHIIDRFTQLKDLHAHNVEENPQSPRLNSFNRFYADVHDLLSHDPDHWLARAYWYWVSRDIADRPEYEISPAPEGVPQWAHLQVEYLRHLERVVMHYIDERQISNGEFGGGLSDDGDFTNMLVGTAFVGIHPERILESLLLHMTSYYDQDRDPWDAPLRQPSLPLFTNGLATILTDELHAMEEGIQVVGQLQSVDHGTPLHINRAMEISRRLLHDITRINPDGQRLFRSRYYSGTRMATEDPWQWSDPWAYHILHPLYLVARYNGNPELQKMVIEMADALMAYADEEGQINARIHFQTGEVRGPSGLQVRGSWPVFLAAYHFSGDQRYLDIVAHRVQKQRLFDPQTLADRYTEEIKKLGVREYIHTKGSIWIDRILSDQDAIQQDRIGGIAMHRINNIYPQNYVRWNIKKPGNFESLALFLPSADERKIEVVAYNLDDEVRTAEMMLEHIVPGRWRVRQSTGLTEEQILQRQDPLAEQVWELNLKMGDYLPLTFPSGLYNYVTLELVEPDPVDYWERADLGMGRDDVRIHGSEVHVRVHSLGAAESPPTTIELKDARGEVVARVPVPGLEAPVDLIPRWVDLVIPFPQGTDLSSGSVKVDPGRDILQISRSNTVVNW